MYFTWKITGVKNEIFHEKPINREEFAVHQRKWFVFLQFCDHCVSCVWVVVNRIINWLNLTPSMIICCVATRMPRVALYTHICDRNSNIMSRAIQHPKFDMLLDYASHAIYITIQTTTVSSAWTANSSDLMLNCKIFQFLWFFKFNWYWFKYKCVVSNLKK